MNDLTKPRITSDTGDMVLAVSMFDVDVQFATGPGLCSEKEMNLRL